VLHRIWASALAALVAFTALASPANATPLPLIDQNGNAFTLGSLRGQPFIVTFVAAHCTDACPLVNAQFAQAQQLFEQQHVNVRLLTITLDPEHDPPAVMRALARRFNADSRHWIVASGNPKVVHAVMNLFGVQAERGRSGYAEMHTTFVYVFDRRGRLHKTLLASTILGSQLADDVRAQWPELAR
jgi:protein SCO1/2